MSRGTAYVRFPGGQVRYGIYNGTADVLWWPLFQSADDAWAAWSDYYRQDILVEPEVPEDHSEPVDVDIATDYGGGFYWRGKARDREVTEGREPWEIEDWDYERCDGLPDWVPSRG